MNSRYVHAAALLAVSVAAMTGSTFAQEAEGSLTGDARRGKPLFDDRYNCYACHGFDAQTGERRLLPMNYTQEGFITFVQNSPLPNMPAFPDAAPQDLADIYAYINSIRVDAPALDQLPLLKDISERKRAALD